MIDIWRWEERIFFLVFFLIRIEPATKIFANLKIRNNLYEFWCSERLILLFRESFYAPSQLLAYRVDTVENLLLLSLKILKDFFVRNQLTVGLMIMMVLVEALLANHSLMLVAISVRNLLIVNVTDDLNVRLDLLFYGDINLKWQCRFDVQTLRLVTIWQRALEMSSLYHVRVAIH